MNKKENIFETVENKIYQNLLEYGLVFSTRVCLPYLQKRSKDANTRLVDLNLQEKVCDHLVSTLFYRLRQLCSLGIGKEDLKLGGSGKKVEIDESLYARVKFHKGKDLKRTQVWVFGLVERNDPSKCFMTVVPDREADSCT
ncbi:putative transposase-like protein [Brachionus plicatilis]|uniref:Putative transposase-like protein n=1 Tax=Brachionus plicatilis TaxID=10195 RepID=A0A3M7PKR5_BRAPC|nr:putative transposase-like protein [Brachionus plicatilis]